MTLQLALLTGGDRSSEDDPELSAIAERLRAIAVYAINPSFKEDGQTHFQQCVNVELREEDPISTQTVRAIRSPGTRFSFVSPSRPHWGQK